MLGQFDKPDTGPGHNGKRIMVLGVGNILLKDEGVGVRVVERMRDDYDFAPDIELMDGGTAGFDLLAYIDGVDHLIIVDTVKTGEPPGSIFRFTPNDINIKVPYKTSLHQIGLVEVFAVAEALGNKIEAVIIGVQPEDMYSIDLELTPTIAARVPDIIELVIRELEAVGVRVAPKRSA